MKRPHQISSVVLILFSAIIVRESLNLNFYTLLGPGPGFFPFWIGLLLGFLGAIMLYQATFKGSDPMPPGFFPSAGGYLRVSAILLALVATVVLTVPLGFRLTMLGFLLFLLYALGRQGPIVTLLVALAGSFGTYYLFVQWLKVPLPVGMFGL